MRDLSGPPPNPPLRIAVVTDAWHPQVNGVVRTLNSTATELESLGHVVLTIGPDRFPSIPCPTYPEIRLALAPGRRLARLIDEFRPDAIHISTEGPLGLAARNLCVKRRWPFTTSFHTMFPDYVHARLRVPRSWSWEVLRWFHAPSAGVFVATQSIRDTLTARGFQNLVHWGRGVDTTLFHPRPRPPELGNGPVFLSVGRIAVEKNVAAFLELDLPGTKVVVGDGPQRASLEARYPEARFLGAKFGDELAAAFAAADVFVFPSRTDTFGLVMLEALACGTPVAAFPVPGPLDVIADSGAGMLHEDLRTAALKALEIPRAVCRAYAETFSWRSCAEVFATSLVPVYAPA